MKLVVLCVAVMLAAVSADNSMSNPLPPVPSEGIRIWTIEDTQAPFIAELRGQVTDLNVQTGGASWTYLALVSDLGAPSSGVLGVVMAFWAPDFQSKSQGFCSQIDINLWSCSGSVSKWDRPGQWPLAWVNATDLQGNVVSLAYDRTKNAAAYITVAGPDDTEAPQLKFFSYYPTSLTITNATSRHQPFTFLANCTDNYSGCSSVRATFTAPGPGDAFGPYSRGLGSSSTIKYLQEYNVWSTNATLTDIFVYRGVMDGDWTFQGVSVSDVAGNFRFYYANEIAGMFNNGQAYPAVNVVGQPPAIPVPSTPAPQLISYNHDISEIDLNLGTQRVCFNTTATGDNFGSNAVQHYIFLSGPTQTTVTCGPTYATSVLAQPTRCFRSRVVDPVTSAPLNQTLLRHCIDFQTFQSHVRQGFYRIVGIGLRTPQGNALYGSCSGADPVTNTFTSSYCTSTSNNLGCRPFNICGELGAGSTLGASAFVIAALVLLAALFN